MLIQFKVKNHKCFYDENVLDLSATMEKRHSEEIINLNGLELLPVVSIHGANASGKTGILEAINFMFTLIINSNKIDVNENLPTIPFTFSEKAKSENTEYEISLCLNDYEYRYGFTINKMKFDEEWLYYKKVSQDSRIKEKKIFERFDKVEFGNEFKKFEKIWNLYKSNKLLILNTLALKEESGVFRDIYNYIFKFRYKSDKVLNKYISIDILSKNSSVNKKFEAILKEADPCLLGINVEDIGVDENGERKYAIYGVHRSNDKSIEKYYLPFEGESNGTIKIFNLMPSILLNLEYGGLLCIDELDTKFHPLLYKKIVNMYKDKKINKNNAQLIFTTHSTFLFNSEDMRRDELYLVEKNSEGKSNIYSLSEFRNLRFDADYEKKYLSGEFGAIPFN